MPFSHYPTPHNYAEANRRTTPEYNDVALELLEGPLPPDLVGTLLCNGNGHFEQHGVLYDHLFDGDGMVARFVFDGQTVRYRNRWGGRVNADRIRILSFERHERQPYSVRIYPATSE